MAKTEKDIMTVFEIDNKYIKIDTPAIIAAPKAINFFLFLLNFVRIVSTILFSLKFGFQYLDIVHTFLWREGLILAVVCVWYLWLKKTKYNIEQVKVSFR